MTMRPTYAYRAAAGLTSLAVAIALVVADRRALAPWLFLLALVLLIRALGDYLGRAGTEEALANQFRFAVIAVSCVGLGTAILGALILTGAINTASNSRTAIGVLMIAMAPVSIWLLRGGLKR